MEDEQRNSHSNTIVEDFPEECCRTAVEDLLKWLKDIDKLEEKNLEHKMPAREIVFNEGRFLQVYDFSRLAAVLFKETEEK